ncbi:MAG: signal peptidase II [Bacilli bacterium]|nr:signal peptidase II [Bacilli bacterium]
MRKKILLFSLIVVLVDQLTKWLVTANISVNSNVVIIKNFLNFTNVGNDGAAWNIFSGSRWFLVCVSILAVFAIIKYIILDLKISKVELVGYFLLLGGIVGNLIDRIFRGSIVDFIDINLFGYHYPVFNIADSCIIVGTILIVFHMIKNSAVKKAKKA